MSKIQFWKQFTTNDNTLVDGEGLFLICQRYNFESNSQLPNTIFQYFFSCFWYVKDTILKAIHNSSQHANRLYGAVSDMSKIQFWKQFTTFLNLVIRNLLLFLICQRYNFESNSQLPQIWAYSGKSCFWYVKDTILKAIHNTACGIPLRCRLFLICQRYNFESNSQRAIESLNKIASCFWYVKDTILKAIHNKSCIFALKVEAVSDMSKIQFWKQFTTLSYENKFTCKLFLICQRYNFESNSQRGGSGCPPPVGCFWYVKDTILKAIHNNSLQNEDLGGAVSDMSKIQFWKQFTIWWIWGASGSCSLNNK